MSKAFCPGHVTAFFAPVITNDVLTTGSLGTGIRLNKGVTVTAEERKGPKTRVTMDGEKCKAKITERVAEILAPGIGFDIVTENELPVSQGMGMSAAGAVAAGLCIASLKGIDEYDAYIAAHTAEVENGGGLGDVAGILGGRQPIRVRAGVQPFGRTVDTGMEIKVSLIVLGPPMDTGNILSNAGTMNRISNIGTDCVLRYLGEPTERPLYELSSEFSGRIGLESKKVKRALSELRKEHTASMCMLGNSIFTSADEDEVRDILGDVRVFQCASGDTGPIIRKA
ncbi:MAG: pantothenate kinase [Methanomassiliicoccaceae archaeon]|jgi:pantoate kinase|nr:pantothenate kinase [Methanomassiliicoccaceae archaeon]